MIDPLQIETEIKEAVAENERQIQTLRQQRKDINVRLGELDLEKRRLRRLANAFAPRTVTPRRQAVDHE